MARQIIQQPNGKFCIFSTSVDNLIFWDLNEDEVITVYSVQYGKSEAPRVKKVISELKEGGSPYFGLTKSFEEVIEIIRRVHGDEEVDQIIQLATQ